MYHLKDKQCEHYDVSYDQVLKKERKEFGELLEGCRYEPDEAIYRDKTLDFLEGPRYLVFEQKIKAAGILEKHQEDLTADEKKLWNKYVEVEDAKRKIKGILWRADMDGMQEMTEQENYYAAIVKYLRFVEYAKTGNKPTYEMYKSYIKGFNKSKVDRLIGIHKGLGPRTWSMSVSGRSRSPDRSSWDPLRRRE